MSITRIINIAQEFSIAPAGRFTTEAYPASGERFREQWLVKALQDVNIKQVVINLDNLEGVSYSFWEEAFGGLLRVNNLSFDLIKTKLLLKCTDDPTLVPLIEKVLIDATNFKKNNLT